MRAAISRLPRRGDYDIQQQHYDDAAPSPTCCRAYAHYRKILSRAIALSNYFAISRRTLSRRLGNMPAPYFWHKAPSPFGRQKKRIGRFHLVIGHHGAPWHRISRSLATANVT